MKYIINLLKVIIIGILVTLIFATLSFIGLINDNTLSVIQIITILVTIFTISYQMGKKQNKKGYLEGIKFGLLTITLFIILNILFRNSITKVKILYYLIIISVSICGSIIGINKKTKA